MIANRKLKLALLSVHSCPVGNLGGKDTGGMNVYVRELAYQLGQQGHLVDVYTRIHDPNDPQIIEIGQNARLIHLKAGQVEDIHKLLVYTYLPDFVCNLEDFRKEDDIQYDLVFSHYWLSGWVGQFLQRWWNVPHMIMFHTLGAIKNAVGIGEDEPELRTETERYLANQCQRIIASTEREKEQLNALYGAPSDRISVIPCGVNLDLFKPMDRNNARRQLSFNDDRIILFVGRIEPLKGIDSLLRAMTYLKDTPNLKLIIVGGDARSQDEVERLKIICQKLNILDLVTFLPLVKQEKLPYYYSAADICVIPSHYESFGLVALESLACGTPVVTTRVGEMENIIRQGETGYVLDDNSPHQLADKISLLLSRPNDGEESINSMLASVAGFRWSNIADMIAKECNEVLSNYLTQVG